MSASIDLGSARDAINRIYKVLSEDEELIRLLWYLPYNGEREDPLSDQLDDLVDKDSDLYWDIVDERILLRKKLNDIEDKKLCRIYFNVGKSRPVFNNHLLAEQDFMIFIYTHDDYESDMRNTWISDRINNLIVNKGIAGIGEIKMKGGDPLDAPKEYTLYRHVYSFLMRSAK